MEAEAYYDGAVQEEWERLTRHRTEFAVSLRAMEDFLPKPPCAVLDIGGGPGRYAIELAGRGYHATLLDISSESLRLARQRADEAGVSLAATVHANALDLGILDDDGFDAVLLMGPLYHLLEHGDRVQAVGEAMRLLRPGGRLFASFITRFAPFRYASSRDLGWLETQPEYARRMLDTGIHDQDDGYWRAYFAHPDEVLPLMEGCGLQTLLLVGCEGVVAGHEDSVNELEGASWEAWVDLNYELGQEPTLYGASDHLLYVGEKPDQARSGGAID